MHILSSKKDSQDLSRSIKIYKKRSSQLVIVYYFKDNITICTTSGIIFKKELYFK
jgi:hypothetical protein